MTLLSIANTEPTFEDCYSDFMIIMMWDGLKSSDPQVQQLITNMCNFYHEKTGKWVSSSDWFGDLSERYGSEFYEKYKHQFPPELN